MAGLASGRSDVLRLLTEDRLHEPYRAAVYPELPRLVSAARNAGALGACLAGSGSTIVAFVPVIDEAVVEAVSTALQAEAAALNLPGRVRRLAMRPLGAVVSLPE
jgi:homoserine kinase